jgi:hypothetical protein
MAMKRTQPIKPGNGKVTTMPVKPGKPGKPVRPGDKLNPLPTVGGKSRDKKLKDLKLQIDKANKAKSPKPKKTPMPKRGM